MCYSQRLDLWGSDGSLTAQREDTIFFYLGSLLSQVENRRNLGLEDPRLWCDKLGRVPAQVAKARKHDEIAVLLEPGSEIQIS